MSIKSYRVTGRIILFYIFVYGLCVTPVLAKKKQEVYYPGKNIEWVRKAPVDLGIDAAKLKEAVEFAKANEFSGNVDLRIAILDAFKGEPYIKVLGPTKKRGGPAGLVIKKGYIIAEWGDLNRVDMTFSVTKSYLSAVAGLAVDAGLIHDVHDKVKDYVWDETFEGKHNSTINWHHLLNQSSDWSGTLFGMNDWADRPPRGKGIDEWRSRKLNPPGTVYKYNDVRVNVLAYSLLQVWRKPLPVVLKEKIMDPIGASTTWRWYGYSTSWVNVDGTKVQSVSGGGHSGGGLFINTLDHARFGLLFLRNGNWKGKQLISRQWIDRSRESSEARSNYGYLWWLNKGDHKIKGFDSLYLAMGFGGHYIVIDEERDMVIVIRWLESKQLVKLLLMIMEAIKKH